MDDERRKQIAQMATRNVAGGLFKQENLAAMYPNVPAMLTDRLTAIFSSGTSISDLAQEVELWKQNAPENKHLIVMLRTPNGELMDVEQVRPSGWQLFIAEGYINGMPCRVAGHIATLSLFCTYDEVKGRNRVGFKVVTEPLNEPQPAPEQTTPDKT